MTELRIDVIGGAVRIADASFTHDYLILERDDGFSVERRSILNWMLGRAHDFTLFETHPWFGANPGEDVVDESCPVGVVRLSNGVPEGQVRWYRETGHWIASRTPAHRDIVELLE